MLITKTVVLFYAFKFMVKYRWFLYDDFYSWKLIFSYRVMIIDIKQSILKSHLNTYSQNNL